MNRRKTTKKQQSASTPNAIARYKQLTPDRQRRLLIQGFVGVGVLAGGGVALAAYDRRQKTLHDLSVVGNGVPTIVQVHDPACPKCRRLKLRTEKILQSYAEGAVQYRLADVTSREGRALQTKYNSPTVTLLLFDGKGTHQGTVQGVQPQEDIKAVIERLFFSTS